MVSFVTACEVFFDPFFRVVDAGVVGKQRVAVIGMTKRWRILFVEYVELEDRFRIFSARPAIKAERLLYENR
ncbi:MAG: BrnT family toxin [Pyrinomonadaceae bacterium]